MDGEPTHVTLNPIEDFFYLLSSVVFGESTIEDFILLVGTFVAFVAFILWCCFPVQPKDAPLPVLQNPNNNGPGEEKYNQIIMEYELATT